MKPTIIKQEIFHVQPIKVSVNGVCIGAKCEEGFPEHLTGNDGINIQVTMPSGWFIAGDFFTDDRNPKFKTNPQIGHFYATHNNWLDCWVVGDYYFGGIYSNNEEMLNQFIEEYPPFLGSKEDEIRDEN